MQLVPGSGCHQESASTKPTNIAPRRPRRAAEPTTSPGDLHPTQVRRRADTTQITCPNGNPRGATAATPNRIVVAHVPVLLESSRPDSRTPNPKASATNAARRRVVWRSAPRRTRRTGASAGEKSSQPEGVPFSSVRNHDGSVSTSPADRGTLHWPQTVRTRWRTTGQPGHAPRESPGPQVYVPRQRERSR